MPHDRSIQRSFDHNGRNADQFHRAHQAAVDSHGNFYSGEVDTGKRIQKFLLRKSAHD